MSTKYIKLNDVLKLENGQLYNDVELAYHTYGELNEDKSNVIWVCHALTANSDVFDWWKGLFGANDLFNPKDHFIICANIIGSHYGSFSPLSVNPSTKLPYFHDFPLITIRDMVQAHVKLANQLGIVKINTLIGGSLGGQQALEWSIFEPNKIDNLILLATNARHSSWGVAFNASQRLAIENDITWIEKNKTAGLDGLKVARSIALLSYRNANAYNLTQKNPLSAISYQKYQGEKLANRFNAFSYWYLSHAMDSHDLGRNKTSIENELAKIKANTLVLSIENDLLFPQSEQEFLVNYIPNVLHKIIPSHYGHDGFLIETEKIAHTIKQNYSFLNHQTISIKSA